MQLHKQKSRNPATDAAYIPGSSLKGAIRTALMNMANKKPA
ncbi:MAG: hypothetical protein IJ564_05670 [Alphaproteobacteria bacterium]|nr:hypothetical protein [Alphaproteobacteria bacterium]